MNWKTDYWGVKPKGYTIVVDAGKPYEIRVDSKRELKRELRKLEKEANKDNPHFDIFIYNKYGVDVTDEEMMFT